MKLVILDRDGVINYDSDHYIKSADEWVPLPGSLQAIAQLNRKGYSVAVATNQSGIGRGYYTEATLEGMHQKFYDLLATEGGVIHELVYCPHLPNEGCECRKPEPGLLHMIADKLGTRLEGVSFVGDSLTDLIAAKNAGALPVLVKTGKGVETLKAGGLPQNTRVFENLDEFANSL